MNITDYEFVDPLSTAVGQKLAALARKHPFRAERLVTALEDFVSSETKAA